MKNKMKKQVPIKRDKLIHAKDVKCQMEGCKNKGYRWISGDPDITPFCYCERHTALFEMRLFDILNEKEKK